MRWPKTSEWSGVITCRKLISTLYSDTVMTSARTYNAFFLKLSESCPHSESIVQKENESDKQHERKYVQEAPGHAGPRMGERPVNGIHGGRSRADEAIIQWRLRLDQINVNLDFE